MSLLNNAPTFFAALSSENSTHSEETVGTSVVSVVLAATTRLVYIFNVSGATLYFRVDSTVLTTANGFPLSGGRAHTLELEKGQTLQLISATAAQDVRILEVAV